ncbi:MAG: PD40 domain-containing protein [Candidatus Eremiobacteraeota bacterium]|nr:PD40 domain-containing protein [Candidatus Eremiobacteraeota bacterium]
MKHLMLALWLALALTAGRAVDAAKPSMQDVLRATFAVHDLDGIDLSPRATAVVWQETFRNAQQLNETRRRTALYLQQLRATSAVRLTAGNTKSFADEEQPVWSPDGRHIAFLSDARSKNQLQLFITDAAGRYARRVTHFDGNVQGVKWSPDSRFIAVLYIVKAQRKAGALAPGERDVGVIGSRIDEQRLTTVNVATGVLRQLSPPDVYVYEYGWSPDSRQIAVTYAHGNGDNNWWIAKLATVDASTGAMRDLLTPKYQIDDPQWSPDGKQVAVIHGIMSDFGSTGGDIYLVDASTGAARNAAPGISVSAQALRWEDPAHLQITATRQRGACGARRSPSGGRAMRIMSSWLVYPLSYDPNKRYPMVMIVHGGPSAEAVPSYAGRNLAALSSQGYFVFMPNPRGSFGQGEAFTAANVKDFGYGDWRDDLSGVDAAQKTAPIDGKRLGLFG